MFVLEYSLLLLFSASKNIWCRNSDYFLVHISYILTILYTLYKGIVKPSAMHKNKAKEQ